MTFKEYYSNLYSSEFPEDTSNMLMFLAGLNIPKINLDITLITLILKPGKDPSMCSSYRPISLLNVDVKILAKILAFRIDSLIPEIVSPDQMGFVKGCYSYTNLQKLLGVLYSPASRKTPEVVISLDAEKASDRVEWGYLFLILKMFSFGPKYVNRIQLLYSTPKVSAITNNIRSQFSLY